MGNGMHQSFSTMAGEVAECGIYKEKARCLSELLAVWTGLTPLLSQNIIKHQSAIYQRFMRLKFS
jgi:hypothetical protein